MISTRKKKHMPKFQETFTVPKDFIGLAIGKQGSNLEKAKQVAGVRFMKKTQSGDRPFQVYAETEEAVKKARSILEVSREKNIPKKIPGTIERQGNHIGLLKPNCLIKRKTEQDKEKKPAFEEYVSVPPELIGLAFGTDGANLEKARQFAGVKFIRKYLRFHVYGESEAAVKKARSILEFRQETVRVSKTLAGLTIGQRGTHIDDIVTRSLVDRITVEDEDDEVVFDIFGSPAAVEKATLLLEFHVDKLQEEYFGPEISSSESNLCSEEETEEEHEITIEMRRERAVTDERKDIKIRECQEKVIQDEFIPSQTEHSKSHDNTLISSDNDIKEDENLAVSGYYYHKDGLKDEKHTFEVKQITSRNKQLHNELMKIEDSTYCKQETTDCKQEFTDRKQEFTDCKLELEKLVEIPKVERVGYVSRTERRNLALPTHKVQPYNCTEDTHESAFRGLDLTLFDLMIKRSEEPTTHVNNTDSFQSETEDLQHFYPPNQRKIRPIAEECTKKYQL